jgi:acyl-CoA synthetase (AMP-forming)/AMP-acid ligase II
MIRLLERAAGASPDQVAVVSSAGTVTYGELLDQARRVAASLRSRNLTQFAIVEPDAALVIALLAGAALAGAEPCQYQPDIAPDEFGPPAAALGHAVVVTQRTDLPASFTFVSPAELMSAEADPTLTPTGEQPLMIRTTGTTGTPKAARHDWQVLGRTVADLSPRPDQRWLLAYGTQQFAGVQVMQHVIASQATLVAPFPRQPKDGLAAVIRDHVTCVSATPTYWRFLLAEARSRKAELPALEQATLGGEAIPADLLEELRKTFPDVRISQIYASTEFGSIASVKDGQPGFGVDALFSDTNPEANLRVVDGELWVRAAAGMLGYAGEDAVATAADADGWRATGDLVSIVGDRVVFQGRRSEVINVGGVKVHPLPIEDKIVALDSVAMVRVYGRPNRLTGAIVAVEVVPTDGIDGADEAAIRDEIKAAVADLPRAWQPRSITLVEAIEMHGAKLVRRMAE